MDTITLSTSVVYGNESLTGSVTLPCTDIHQGVVEATTTYAVLVTPTVTPQAILISNGGVVDVSVRLTFSTNKYAFVAVPAGYSVVVPGYVNVNNGNTPAAIEEYALKTASSTADVTYVIVY